MAMASITIRNLEEDVKTRLRVRATEHDRETPSFGRGGVLAALRRSPMVGADLDLTRASVKKRKIDL